MREIVLKQTLVNDNRVEFDYVYPEEWHPFVVDPNEKLFAEYGFGLTDIHHSILNVLFVANVLTISMFENRTICVDELDKEFYRAIPQILDGYRALYPDRDIGCTVKCTRLIDNSYTPSEYKILAFTGGVDATSAMATHVQELLVLANIWGGDIRLDNQGRYFAHKQYFERLAHRYGYGFEPVKSNFRFIYDDTVIPYKFAHDWWSAVGHSLLIVATFAPIAYQLRSPKIYLASSYTEAEYAKGGLACCNSPQIVDAIAFASCRAEQSDRKLSRGQKIDNIVEKLSPKEKNEIQILACWNHQKDSVVNCCYCEKCARTIMNITACKTDPSLFGFDVDNRTYLHIRRMVLTQRNLPEKMWTEIKEEFVKNRRYWKRNKNLKWILKVDINNPPKPSVIKRGYWKIRLMGSRIKNKIQDLIK